MKSHLPVAVRAHFIGVAAVKTGVFELSGPKTVIDILGMAGGVSEKAGTQVQIYRQGANGCQSHVIDLLSRHRKSGPFNSTAPAA